MLLCVPKGELRTVMAFSSSQLKASVGMLKICGEC